MIYLVGAILLIQLINLILNGLNSNRVGKMNDVVMERQRQAQEDYKKKDAEFKAIQLAQIEELRELVKGSKYLEGMIDGMKQENK